MKYSRILSILVAVLFITPVAEADKGPQHGYLWNVNSAGDTLRYLNYFPQERTAGSPGLPQYLAPREYQEAIHDGGSNASIRISPDVLALEKAAVGYQEDVRRLERSHKEIWWPIAAMGVTGTLSAYFKLEANEAYRKYSRAIDHDNINRYYSRTREYDTYSGVSFVLLQASFGWLIYELMW